MRLAMVAVTVLGASIAAGDPLAQDGKVSPAQRFEVASIKPAPPMTTVDCKPPTCFPNFYMMSERRFRATKMSVIELVQAAYSMSSMRIIGPDWASSERFDVEATHGLPANDRGVLLMLQNLLQDRFALRLHREQRPIPVFVLSKARDDGKLGPQLRSISECKGQSTFLPAYISCSGQLATSGPTTRMGRGPWEKLSLAQRLWPSVDRPVVDETGLTGMFELRLDWSDAPDGDKPVLFTALREQLGLKLERAERPMEVIVIDRVDRPTPN